MTDRTEFIPLGGSVQGTDVSVPTELIQNFVPVIAKPSIGGKAQLRMFKRRGFQNNLVAAASGYVMTPESIFQWSGVAGTGTSPATLRGVIVYTENKSLTDLRVYKWNTSETLLGTFATASYSCFAIQETLISGTPNLTLQVGKTVSPYDQKLLVFPNGGALAEVTDGDFPVTTIGPGVHMDGYYIVASTDGYLYWSDLNSVTAWTSGNRIAVQMEPDSLVGVAKVRNVIWALGTKTLEPYQMTGNTNPIMQRIAQATIRVGAAGGLACCSTGQELYFVGNGAEGFGAYVLEGFAVRKISNAFIDALFAGNENAFPILGNTVYRYDAVQGPVKHHGVTGIMFNIILGGTGANSIYIYYPESGVWTKFLMISVGAGNNSFCSASGNNLALQNANLVWFDDYPVNSPLATSGQDKIAGTLTSFEAFIQTAPLTHGTAHRKFYKSARLIGDQQTVATPVILSSSDDNGATFTTHGTFDMSVNPIVPITRMGSSRKRIWKLSNTSAAGCVIDGLELTYEIGTN